MEHIQACRMLWQERENGGACLYRLYGASPQICLPSQIAGRPLVEVAPYCFAKNPHMPPPPKIKETIVGEKQEVFFLKELCGTAVEEVIFPDSVKKIGGYAFYNCKNLRKIQMGLALREIGSDAFMNTISFHSLELRCGAFEESGIRQILSRISSDISVKFLTQDKTQALLFYPEYYETYDEIAPAHLFGRQIRGEGFRARQRIKDGCVDFDGYDAIFPQACVEETERVLGQMALGRLRYPCGLQEKCKNRYREYVKEHIGGIAARLVREKSLDTIQFLLEEELLSLAALSECALLAAETGWTQGAAYILQMAARKRETKKNRYEFDLD
ncbi:MAG: leucine-rich repeat domain-containing protein [Eubacterium sp.]|jgi:hypothetical protein|nr:leucine-rich repeat domain-containing protein [Eubacterium sp.]